MIDVFFSVWVTAFNLTIFTSTLTLTSYFFYFNFNDLYFWLPKCLALGFFLSLSKISSYLENMPLYTYTVYRYVWIIKLCGRF